MSAPSAAGTLPAVVPLDGGSRWEQRHRILGGLVMAVVSARLGLSTTPVYADLAQVGALVGLIGGGHMRQVAAAARRALGSESAAGASWRFAWNGWPAWYEAPDFAG